MSSAVRLNSAYPGYMEICELEPQIQPPIKTSRRTRESLEFHRTFTLTRPSHPTLIPYIEPFDTIQNNGKSL
jgi:hypothetical protein